MKNIFKNWMSILTLCLCLGAMAVGVLSITQASASMNGQIGFVPHEIEANINLVVSASMWGHSCDGTPDGTPVAKQDAEDLGTYTFANGMGNLSFSPNGEVRCFTDVASSGFAPDDIVVKLEITNNSSVDIQLELDKINTSLPEHVKVTTDLRIIKIEVGNTEQFLFRLSCPGGVNYNIETPATQNVNVLISVEEWTVIKSGLDDSGATYHYIEMGANPLNGEAIRWIPFAEYDETLNDGTGGYKQFLSTNKPQKNKTYYFISERVLDLWLDSTSSDAYGLSYGYYDSENLQNGIYYVNGQPVVAEGIDSTDYSISNVRAYLIGEEAYKTHNNHYAETSQPLNGEKAFATYFDLENDPMFTGSYITPRHLSGSQNGATFSLYSDIGDKKVLKERTFIPSQKAEATDADMLWIPSYYEIYTYYGNSETRNYFAYKLTEPTSLAGWYLRTAFFDDPNCICEVKNLGTMFSDGVFGSSSRSIRPAFQITI